MIVFFFFFSSRRRHTRLTCDWSSDVCSSDLAPGRPARCAGDRCRARRAAQPARPRRRRPRSEERRVGKGVDLGGRRIIKKKKKKKKKKKEKEKDKKERQAREKNNK